MVPRGFRTLACLLLALGPALGSCKEPVAGECLGGPGALCLTVRNAGSFPAGLRVVLDVRVGACDALPAFPCQGGAAVTPVPGCKLSCRDLPVPERFSGSDGRFTAEVDLSGSPGTGQAGARLYSIEDPGGSEACAGQGTQPFSSGLSALVLDPQAAACPPRKKRCTGHVDCGGALATQLCDHGVCVDAPADLCPPEMTLIPAGALVLGDLASMNPNDRDRACATDGGFLRHRVTRPFCLDRTEATVAGFRACVGSGCAAPMGPGCTYPLAGSDELPVNCLSHAQAAAFCAFRSHNGRGGRLPTEAEWEWAAARDPKRRYPWDDSTPANICDYANAAGCESGALKVRRPGLTPRGNSPSAPAAPWPAQPLVDLAGNLAEWVADVTPAGKHSYCDLTPLDDPQNVTGTKRLVRGGSFADLPATLYTYARNEYEAIPDATLGQRVGVRCALTPALPTP